jgi:membrane-associated protease RseP (regulator of RpoE activity)
MPREDQQGGNAGGYRPRPSNYRPNYLIPALLFIATIITTVISGALYEGAHLLADPASILRGVPFSASLIFILGTHELGHYIASRRHGIDTTLPTFIPGPPIPPMIGTFGAVIRIRSAITSKHALVDIGAAGPLAGFVVAIFVCFIGLEYSSVVPTIPNGTHIGLGDSLIFKGLSYLVFGDLPEGHDVLLHPVAFSGWLGFFVTALNLLPMGQLDGGHIIYALVGPRHRLVSMIVAAVLVVLGITMWPGWFLWAALITILGMRHPPLTDQTHPLDGRRRLTCAAAIIVFILTFMPTPFYII